MPGTGGGGGGSSGTVRLQDLPGKRTATPVRTEAVDFNVWKAFFRNLILVTALTIGPGTFAIVTTLGFWVMSGVPGMRSARMQTISAEDEYHRSLQASQPLLAELGVLGIPQDQLEVVYFAFENASEAEHRHLADQYLGVLIDQTNIAVSTRGEASIRARKLLAPSLDARRRTSEAYLGWYELVNTTKGRVILWLGMVAGPAEGMELYRVATVRKLLPPPTPGGR